MEATTPITWPRMLTGHQGVYGRVSACLQHAIWASSLNKGYTSIRPDGVVTDRSVGQYCNTEISRCSRFQVMIF